ncbi:RA and C1 1 domain containing protein [Trichuris trichiura]|uniref:RA and C1 1 domain containing protein n=1 Tax=Trichuris trichiura TaxID=36087 RepID=A0A077YYN2_TRITR|nr:RA and C1 1 domain containing protein [Trichuris trichiura]
MAKEPRDGGLLQPSASWYVELPSKLLTFIPSDLFSNLWSGLRKDPQKDDLLFSDSDTDWSDTLDLQHFGSLTCLIPTGKRQLGEGHRFEPVRLTSLTWCDKCGEFIWGLFKQAFRCSNCYYTCHNKCRALVTLDCRCLSDSLSSKSTELTFLCNSTMTSQVDNYTCKESLEFEDDIFVDCHDSVVEWDSTTYCFPYSGQKLVDVIELYNRKAAGLAMTLAKDGFSFRGFVKLLINFTRPVSTVDLYGEIVNSSFYDMVNETAESSSDSQPRRRTLTSFYLPRNCVKTLHITSDTTTHEMIVSLLKKFHIADNPRKFALYERDLDAGSTLQSKVPDDVCPLQITLLWGAETNKRFVLQENETGDIMWDSFEIPELCNFLTILEIEEQQYISKIRNYYKHYQRCLEQEIHRRTMTECSKDAAVI